LTHSNCVGWGVKKDKIVLVVPPFSSSVPPPPQHLFSWNSPYTNKRNVLKGEEIEVLRNYKLICHNHLSMVALLIDFLFVSKRITRKMKPTERSENWSFAEIYQLFCHNHLSTLALLMENWRLHICRSCSNCAMAALSLSPSRLVASISCLYPTPT